MKLKKLRQRSWGGILCVLAVWGAMGAGRAQAQMPETNLTAATFTADNPRIDFVGKWGFHGSGASARAFTAESGNSFRAVLSSTKTCTLNFDTGGSPSKYNADIAYQIDGGGWQRVRLDATGVVAVKFPTIAGVSLASYDRHTLEVVADGIPENSNQWVVESNGMKLVSISLDAGGTLLQAPINPNQIQFDGDSITEGFNLLGSVNTDLGVKAAHIDWPFLTAQSLGMDAAVAGHSGDGLLRNYGSAEPNPIVPYASGIWGKVSALTPYSPAIAPRVEVVAYGTNDAYPKQGEPPTPTKAFGTAYNAYLTQIRKTYPKTLIECVVLYHFASYLGTINSVVAARKDKNIVVHDYTTLFNAGDTTDGTHPNPAGAAVLATQLANDIQADLAARNRK